VVASRLFVDPRRSAHVAGHHHQRRSQHPPGVQVLDQGATSGEEPRGSQGETAGRARPTGPPGVAAPHPGRAGLAALGSGELDKWSWAREPGPGKTTSRGYGRSFCCDCRSSSPLATTTSRQRAT
jgi:hypothetical protein